MATAKQKAWRRKFAKMFGKKRKSRSKTRVKTMRRRTRRKSVRRRARNVLGFARRRGPGALAMAKKVLKVGVMGQGVASVGGGNRIFNGALGWYLGGPFVGISAAAAPEIKQLTNAATQGLQGAVGNVGLGVPQGDIPGGAF